MKIKLLIITHGSLGEEFLKTVREITGKDEDIEVFGIFRCDPVSKIKEHLNHLVERLTKTGALLILTDIFGGTPMNLSIPHLASDRVEIITGVNLPMLITAVYKKEVKDVKKLADIVLSAGLKSIVIPRRKLDKGARGE